MEWRLALESSVARLRQLVDALPPERLATQSYARDWTIADVLSHIGSGAVILLRRLDDTVLGNDTPADFASTVWDEWNAKPAAAQAADALVADQAFVERLQSITEADSAGFTFAMGPLSLDLTGFIGLRLSEHALHTWDIEVAGNPMATVAPDATRLVVDNLDMIVRFTATPTGTEANLQIHTSEPDRDFLLSLAPDAVSLAGREEGDPADEADLVLPAEAFIRLVYGRLDPAHTQPVPLGAAHLDELRRVFPGL